MNADDRLTELETRLLYAENTIDELNKTIAIQNQDIVSIKKYAIELKEKFDELKNSSGSGAMEFEKPPHY